MTLPVSEKAQTSMDPESLKVSRPSWRKLDIFLLASVVLIFTSIAGLSAGMFYSLWKVPKSCIEPPSSAQSSAHLEAVNFEIKDGIMEWHDDARKGFNILGSDFKYNTTSKQLHVLKDGVYYVYAQLSVHRVLEHDAIHTPVIMTVCREGSQRQCNKFLVIKLPASATQGQDLLSKFTAAVIHLSAGDKLFVELSGPSTIAWQLSQEGTNFFGLFRVDKNPHIDTKC
ncbi:tumor necrosis factor ligand superfamily member 9 [Protopterus annectens]|uniref:tumor necrosis factor ligand superfamily member 9 n=1 Tax=Protopterus annectens TaxID=7888 RepID=UPI001CF97F2F|nr:tumor necrosis factor ligand superfamily member 9 [Protopterus annectens]